jgi:hypothetical protein
MLVEYHLPLTSERADVVLAGTHPQTGQASYVVVELKQWSAAYAFEGVPEIVEVPGAPGGPRLHPHLIWVQPFHRLNTSHFDPSGCRVKESSRNLGKTS